jgi:MoaA/NifB/PqqE/SkfB family radical SAM enzyme
MNNDVYCALPWMQLMITPSGDYKVCCFSGDHTLQNQTHGFCLDENDKPMNVLTHSMQEALDSKTSVSIRQAQLENKRHAECSVCWNKDDDGSNSGAKLAKSFRVMRTFHQYPKWGIETNSDIVTTSELKIRSLDLRFTNKCNLKCIMCTPLYSDLWYEDYSKLYGEQFGDRNVKYTIIRDENGKYKSDMPNWFDTDIWRERFDSVKNDLQHLYITGGEPFIVKGHLDTLDNLIDCDLAKNITIDYDTNLTVINHKLLERFSKFKKIIISVSLDDIGDRYEYFRYPGKFDTISTNLKFLIENKPSNVVIKAVTSCLGVLNVYAPWRFLEFLESQNMSSTYVAYRLLRSPAHFDIRYLPKQAKDEVLKYYQTNDFPGVKESLVVGHLMNNYNMPDHECISKMKEHIAYLDKLDILRGLDWRKTFPETRELLKPYDNNQ